jgi:hypothetical protein
MVLASPGTDVRARITSGDRRRIYRARVRARARMNAAPVELRPPAAADTFDPTKTSGD